MVVGKLKRNIVWIFILSIALGAWSWNLLPLIMVTKKSNERKTGIDNTLCSTETTTQPPSFNSPIPETASQSNRLEVCPAVSDLLKGRLNATFAERDTGSSNWPPTLEEIAVDNPGLQTGGYYSGPKHCKPSNDLVIIIPFRDRDKHLRYLLHFLHLILQRQQARYMIIVAEQDNSAIFNKGQLMNAAFDYASKLPGHNFNCYFFHDVDLISENDRLLYKCQGEQKVVHLAAHIDKYNYSFCCGLTVGGVLGMTKQQFKKVNGFSNAYYGWGGEDDDINARILFVGKFKIYRPGEKFARFKMVSHKSDSANPRNPQRSRLLRNWGARQARDGINSLETKITSVVKRLTHTRLLVKIKPAPK